MCHLTAAASIIPKLELRVRRYLLVLNRSRPLKRTFRKEEVCHRQSHKVGYAQVNLLIDAWMERQMNWCVNPP